MIQIGDYTYEKTSYNDNTIKITNTKTNLSGYILSESEKDWEAIVSGKADPIKDGWEDGLGNILSSVI